MSELLVGRACLSVDPMRHWRDDFPSLSLMQQPARGLTSVAMLGNLEVAKPLPRGAKRPRLRRFPGGPGHSTQWRCRIENNLCVGWGNTEVRAWNAWVDAYHVWHKTLGVVA